MSSEVIKPQPITKICKRCEEDTRHRWTIDKTIKIGGYYTCSVCSENNSKKHRRFHWFKYLAQKANTRKRPGSERMSEELLLAKYKFQEETCALTGMRLNVESEWWKPSLDRIDSSLGYTAKNIRIVAWIVNHTRGDLTDAEYINMCNRVASCFHKYPYAEHCVLNDLNG